jgi:DNA-binding response OmpR family regulator
MRPRAVIVDDDEDLRALIEMVLARADIETATAATGEEGLQLVRELRPHLVTLDVGLPDIDGTEVCRRLREFSDALVMMITAHNDEVNRLLALDLGADDYLPKPFSPRELAARSAALLRRVRTDDTPTAARGAAAGGSRRPAAPGAGAPAGDEVLEAGGGLVLLPVRHVATLAGEPVPLTPAEVDLLAVLAREPGQTWSRGDLVAAVWGGDFIESDYLVDVHVASLRRKLRKAGGRTDWIRTIAGTAYALEPPA